MTSIKITRKCRICGIEFTPRHKTSTLCSWACRAKSKITALTLICRECGNEYSRPKWQIKQRGGSSYFCSRDCGFKHGKPFEKKFWDKVEKTDTCWLWRGSLSNKGYGVTRFKDKAALAHRVSFEIHNFPIPKGLVVMHSCDNPACVNPEHLEIGTQRSNMTDCANKKRNLYGAKNPNAKFTDETIIEARILRGQGFTYLALSKHFNISRQTISRALRGDTWKHVKC